MGRLQAFAQAAFAVLAPHPYLVLPCFVLVLIVHHPIFNLWAADRVLVLAGVSEEERHASMLKSARRLTGGGR